MFALLDARIQETDLESSSLAGVRRIGPMSAPGQVARVTYQQPQHGHPNTGHLRPASAEAPWNSPIARSDYSLTHRRVILQRFRSRVGTIQANLSYPDPAGGYPVNIVASSNSVARWQTKAKDCPSGRTQVNDSLDVEVHDSEVLAEIELMTNLIIATSESEGPLPQQRIDEILGVEQ